MGKGQITEVLYCSALSEHSPAPDKRDLRVRKHLGSRYDAIPNVFDWDCSMKLADRGASIINSRQYAYWRREGVAFTIREATYDTPNLTLSSGLILKHEGERFAHRGFWGDIVVSPYIAFGIESEERAFFKKSNNLYTMSAQNVSEYNMLSLLYELMHREKYELPKPEETPPEPEKPKLQEITEEDEEKDEKHPTDEKAPENQTDNAAVEQEYEAMPMEDVRLFVLPLNSLPDLHKKSRYSKLFDMVYMSNSMVHELKDDLMDTVADKATFILETAKFMTELNKQQCDEYYKKVVAIGQGLGLRLESDCVDKDPFARFTYIRPLYS